MKKIVFFKPYLNQEQNGFILFFAILLFLIIIIFTLSFFYLQFLEVDLFANGTKNLQAFYLAEAGLEQGIMIFNQGQRRRGLMNVLLAHNIFEDPLQRTNIDLSPDRQGTFYSVYRYEGDDNAGIVTITGIGIVDGNYNERREVESRFIWQNRGFQPVEDWPGEHFGPIVAALENTVVMSELRPKLEEVITFIRIDEHEFKDISKDQSKITLFSELDPGQQEAYRNFANYTKTDITQARRTNVNDNELLFPEESRHLYNSPYLEGISTTAHLQMLYGGECPFEYNEKRATQGGLSIISSSSMTIKSSTSNEPVTLEGGLYFFESLTLEKNAILNTNGDVQIYVKKLELKENARLLGGPSKEPKGAKPNSLVILAQRWDGAYHDPEDGVNVKAKAKIAGHIFAPNLKVRLSRGSKGKETRVHGSILTYQLVTYIEPGRQAEYGPIQIIYEEYLNEITDPIEGSWREVRNP